MNDRIDEFFEREREAVPFLVPPAGRFEELQTVARRRRNRNTTAVSAAAAVVLAVAGTGAVLGAQNLGGGGHVNGSVAGPTSAQANRTSAVPGLDPTVPQGFQAWSVSFASLGAHGWALGGYPCSGGQECVGLLETTDSMKSWHTLAKPGSSKQLGVSADHAVLRFAGSNGWMVGSDAVYSSHDAGRTWNAVPALRGQSVDALEAWGTHTYAVGHDASALWVSTDPSADSWTPQTGLNLPALSTGGMDTIAVENRTVLVERTQGGIAFVRESVDNGVGWSSVSLPCKRTASPPLVALVQDNITRVSCGDGSLFAMWLDHTKPNRSEGSFALASDTGQKVQAVSASTNSNGSVFAYSGDGGLWNIMANGETRQALPGDFSYVGLSSDTQGIALPGKPGNTYWITRTGGLTWIPETWS